MTVNLKEYIAAGFDQGWYMLLDSGGVVAGASGSVSAGAAGEAAARMKGVQTADLNIPEPETVDIPGDDIVQGQFIFAPGSLPSFTMETGVVDLTTGSRYQGTLVHDVGDLSYAIIQPNDPVYADVALLLTRRNKSKASGSDGVGGYEHCIIPRCNLVWLGAFPLAGRQGAVNRFRVSVTTTDQPFATGVTMTNAVNGTSGGAIIIATSENPMTWHRFTADGVTTVFGPVGETPASSNLNKSHVYLDGIRQSSGVTISTANKTYTITPVKGSGVKIPVFYEYTK
jgi:hypothetical protein